MALNVQALVLAKKYADTLSLGFVSIEDMGGGVVRFNLTEGGHLDVEVPTIKGDKGDTGERGEQGDDGFSPLVTVTPITGGHRVTITDVTGAHTFTVLDGEGSGSSTPYKSLERLRSYLYRVTFDSITEPNDLDGGVIAGCSSFVQNGKLYRNLDWNYSETIAFNVVCNGFEGMAFIDSLTESALVDETIAQLPYHMMDGRNDFGISVSTHVLYNDWDWQGTGDVPLSRIPYVILSQIKTLDNFEEQMTDILADVYAHASIADAGYLLQFLVTDGTTTYVIAPPTSASGSYVVIDATENPKLTNFRWVADSTVVRANLQTRPMGVERWNMIPCSLADLRYTKCYEQSNRLSEFIGEGGTTKDSTDEELLAIYTLAHAIYNSRTRDGQTWQTFYSAVYSDVGLEVLNAQENFTENFGHGAVDLSDYYTKTEVDSALAGKVSTSTYTDDQTTINAKFDSIDEQLSTKSDSSHNHDSRYYTESEIDSKLALKADADDLDDKADKPSGITGDFLALGANGAIVDSNKKASDFATLDASGRVPYSQLPESAMELKGVWNASTNTPTLTQGVGTNGDFYIVTVGGTWDGTTFAENDRIVFVGGTLNEWTKLSGADVSSKADKVSGAVSGNFAGLDSNGNLVDSGKKPSDYYVKSEVDSKIPSIAGKADKVSGATNGNFASLDASGNLVDSGKKPSDFTTVSGSEFFLARLKMILIPNNSDLNTFIVPGSYGTGGVSATTNIANSPFGSGFPFSMIVESQMKDGDDSTYGYFRQTVKKFSDDVVMTRRTTNGGANWTAWEAFAMSSAVTGKADKVSGATNGHFAGLDSNGNLTDSGKSASDLLTVSGDGSIFSTQKYVNIADGTDLNNLKAPGTYGTAGYDGTTNIVNSPFGNNPFNLLVENQMKAGQGFIRQTAKKYNANTIMTRYSNDTGSTWSAWASIAMSTETKPAWQISSGTFLGQVNADATSAANLGTFQMRDIKITTTDPGAGSALDDGKIIIVI